MSEVGTNDRGVTRTYVRLKSKTALRQKLTLLRRQEGVLVEEPNAHRPILEL